MLRLVVLLVTILAASARGHVVEQFHGTVEEGAVLVLFDVGYADPETRDDPFAPQPTREWLVSLGPAEHERLRAESEEYLRAYLSIPADAKLAFPDFEREPPDFERLLSGGAYFRVRVPVDGTLRLAAGNFPDLALRFPDDTYRTLKPGESIDLGGKRGAMPPLLHSFLAGFLHVLPAGLDHILFILAIFLLVREWRPLLWASLAFTCAHTITLGLGAAGVIAPSPRWVEPLIALSIAVLALENLWLTRFRGWRLAAIFGFGLVHGMGFANALARGLREGEGFLGRLVCANLGVEAAQVVILGNAWMLTARLARRPVWSRFRTVANAVLAAVALLWFFERLG